MGKPVEAGDVVGSAEAISVKPAPNGQSILATCQKCQELYVTNGAHFRKGNRKCACYTPQRKSNVLVGVVKNGVKAVGTHGGKVQTLCTRCGRTGEIYASRFGKPCLCSRERVVPSTIGIFKVGRPTGKRNRRGMMYHVTCMACGANHQRAINSNRLGKYSCSTCKGKVLRINGILVTHEEAADTLGVKRTQLSSALKAHVTLRKAVQAIKSKKPHTVPTLGLTYNNRELVKLSTGTGSGRHLRHRWKCLRCGKETELPVYQARKTGCFNCRRPSRMAA